MKDLGKKATKKVKATPILNENVKYLTKLLRR